MDYPPPRHLLRDLRLEIARADGRVEVSGPGPLEARSRGGGVSAGVLGVAVDVLGATRLYVETDAQGKFEVSLPPGRYVFRVREGRRRMEFVRQLPADRNDLDLRITW